MSRRARAAAFLAAAAVCAALAASLASGYERRLEEQYGSLRAVLIAAADLRAGKAIERSQLEVRRVPEKFVPPDAVSAAGEAVGLAPKAVVPRGGYLLAAQLADEPSERPSVARAGRSPVEIAVSGGEAVVAAGSVRGRFVDVVVTQDSPSGSGGRTYVAAHQVELLALHRGTDGGAGEAGPEPGWTATLAVTHAEALKLIAAENFARQVRLLPRG